MKSRSSDVEYMKRALELAERGAGYTSPNPLVGCLIVKDGKIVGEGYHKRAGGPHAEINALRSAGGLARGATMYVTLEPCSHYGKTPPCTDAIIKEGIARVVIATKDPNPIVNGRGIKKIKEAGIEVEVGIMEMEARRMNEAYEKFIRTKTPFVLVKAAVSVDGRMAAPDGSSKWISSEKAREVVHELRGRVDAVMVGVETIIKDDPELTCRTGGRNPKRIVVDSMLRIPSRAKVLDNQAETIIATTSNAPVRRIEELEKRAKVLVIEERGGLVSLRALLKVLGAEGISSVMVEGGGRLIGSAIDEGVVDKFMFFISPKIIGGGRGIERKAVESLEDAVRLERVEMREVGEDFLLIGYPRLNPVLGREKEDKK